jgi:hypothetical protein
MSLTPTPKSARNLVIVLLVWMCMLFAALGLVRRYGTRTFPQGDEVWALYDAGPGIHLHWLWKTWAEHRIPLAKLIWKGVLELTDYDFRTGDFLTVFGLAGVALLMIWTANRIRGRTILADAFFPLAALNFGQAQAFLWWWQVNQMLAPITAGLLLSLLLVCGNNLQPASAAFVGLGLVVLALCGPSGLPYVISLAGWLGIWTATAWRSLSPSRRKQRLAVLVPVAIALGLVCFYFVDYMPYFPANDPPSVPSWPPSPGLLASAIACLQILGFSLGTATKPHAALCGVGILAFSAVTVALLIRTLLDRRAERGRTLALILFLAASAMLVLVIGRSRAGMGLDYIYHSHYLTLLVPALCCMYFAWEIHGGIAARSVQFGMLAALAALLPVNFRHAIHAGRDLQQKTAAFERDVRSGMPAMVLAERQFASDVVPRSEKLDLILRDHKTNGIGIFKEIREDPPFRIESLGIETALLNGMTLRDGIASSMTDGYGGSLTFTLPWRRHIYAIRLRYAYIKTASAWPALRIYWRDSAEKDFNEVNAWVSVVAGPDQPTWALIGRKIKTDAKVRTDRSLTIWIDSIIDQFRLYPDSAFCEFRLSKIELLVPVEAKAE